METFTMNRKERARLETLGRVGRGEVTLAMAGELLDLSYRQIKRVYARYQAEGDRGLVHRLRGRASNRQPDARTKARVLELYQEHYADFGPTLAAEYLNEEDGWWWEWKHFAVGFWRRVCGRSVAVARRIGVGGGGKNIEARWCKWTARTTTGLRVAVAGRC